MSLRRATSDTDAPGSKVCSASCRLNSRGKFGRLPGAGLLLSTISATLVPTKIFGGNQITFLHRNTESGRHEALTELCALVQEYRQPLSAIMARLLDLLPVVRSGYYHPAMKGSFSVKQVAPTVCPELDYSSLGEVTDGSAVQRAWWEASSSTTDISRRTQLVANMLRYCQHDTLSTLALFRALELGRSVSLDELVVSVGDCKEGVSR